MVGEGVSLLAQHGDQQVPQQPEREQPKRRRPCRPQGAVETAEREQGLGFEVSLHGIMSRDKEANIRCNPLIQNHRMVKPVHEILALKHFGFSITSK